MTINSTLSILRYDLITLMLTALTANTYNPEVNVIYFKNFGAVIITLIIIAAPLLLQAQENTDITYLETLLKNGIQFTPQQKHIYSQQFTPPAGPVREPHRDDRGGPDDFGYRWIDSDEDEGGPEYGWIEINEDGEGVQLGDDQSLGPFDIGFEFPFYDEIQERFNICSNGFITFGNAFNRWDHRDHEFPEAQNVPLNTISPLWMDLNPGGQARVFYWTNDDEDMLVVEWDNVPTFNWDWYDGRGPKKFELILHQNGRIIFQYFDDNAPFDQGVIGIQNEDGSIGLTVSANQEYIHEGLAVRINAAAGTVVGRVIRLDNDEPIAEARVVLSDGTTVETDDDGAYEILDVGEDSYTATVSAYGYNSVTSDEFEVLDEEETEVNFAMPHPEIEVDVDDFRVQLDPQEGSEEEFTITNDGDGELEFGMRYTVPAERDDAGDVHFDWSASEPTEDEYIRGVTTDGESFYVTGSNGRDGDPNYVYVFNRAGDLIRRFAQPVEEPTRFGMKGIATDGSFLYSADGRDIVKFSTRGEVISVIPGPVDPSRYIAYDPETDHLWVCDRNSDIIEIDMDGNVISEIDSELRIRGLAWHPEDVDGYHLYASHSLEERPQVLSKINPINGDVLYVMDYSTGEDDDTEDISITNSYNPLVWMLVAYVERGRDDRITGVEIALDMSWVDVDPMEGAIEPESSQIVTVEFSSGNWAPGTYELVLVIESNAAGDAIEIPLTMTVTGEGLEPEHFEFTETEIEHNITIGSVVVRGLAAEWGDEIGIFTPDDLCAGAALWLGRATNLTAFGDDPDTDEIDGFENDQEFSFKVWDADLRLEFEADYVLTGGDDVFTPDGASRVTIEIPGLVREIFYDLPIGWSMISTNLELDVHNVVTLFADFAEQDILGLVKDGSGRFYSPADNFNNIPEWIEAEGYLVKLNRSSVFRLTGVSIDREDPIQLDQGWNMISYFPRASMDPRAAFEPLGENLVLAKDGYGHFYLPDWNFSNMGELSATNGYLVKVNEDAEFHYPVPDEGVNLSLSNFNRELEHFTSPTSTGSNMSLLIIPSPSLGEVEFAVLSKDGLTCGSAFIGKGISTGLAVWGDDPTTTEIDGLVKDESLLFQAWNSEIGAVPLSVKVISGRTRYNVDDISIIEISNSHGNVPEELSLADCYPNPFNDRTSLKFSLPEGGVIDLTLYDLNGRAVSQLVSGYKAAGNHSLSISANGMASGTYLLRLEAADQVKINKLVLLR